MKSFYLGILLTIFLMASCSAPEKKTEVLVDAEEAIVEDPAAIRIAERAEKFKGEEDRIIGSEKFFISQKEWERNVDSRFSEFRNPDKEDLSNYYLVGNYGFFTAYPAFYNDSLYRVQFRGQLINYKDYKSKIPAAYKAAMDLYTQKYGEPDESIKLPEYHQTPSNALIPLAVWQVGPKIISICLNCDDSYYDIDLLIYRKDIADRKTAEESKAAKQRTAADADKI